MFAYLQDVLYSPSKAALNVDELSGDVRELGEGVQFIGKCILEAQEFAGALAEGDLGVPTPSRGNVIVASLKSLHASLRHMTWQTQQVAKGDYGQRIEFMGDFADAFNTMVEQLDTRQQALLAEVESGRRKTVALEQSNSLFEAIIEKTSQCIVVVEAGSGERLFMNRAAEIALQSGGGFGRVLAGLRDEDAHADVGAQTRELAEDADGKTVHVSVTSYPLNWRERSAVVYVLSDISAEKELVHELEEHAYSDPLTGLNNRYYGMQRLRELVADKAGFCLCFADLDNLKYVNDTFGHAEGDLYIIESAKILVSLFGHAVVCRLGGDEFMVLAPGFAQAHMRAVMQRADEALDVWRRLEQKPYSCSISYGLAQLPEGGDAQPSELLGLADERMYALKRERKARRRMQATEEARHA